ncbi:hypothetical protein DRF67_05390 [Chryseobacterium pennipullorum]|uniref:Uncharacterized protein n=1 Tax=Chryseobacterium pennipullorum TaxID=2258963 RepID=A0A3D9B7D5_9FLAO|nr:hypothetical protein DRF67_05390 [Chryseobacterium pennipullorum]
MKPIFLMLFIAAASFTQAQAFPPPPAVANSSQKQLIDEFLEVSRYKEALINYAKEYLELKMFDYNVDPPKELLTKEQARTIINRFDFDDFKPSLHSSLSFISEKNLKELIQFHKGIGSTLSRDNSVFLITPSIDLNIKNQIDYAIENIKK